MKLSYRKAVNDDADLLIDIYNSSFYNDYVRYGKCPAYGKTKEEMELSIKNFTKYIIMCDNAPVGVISFDKKEDGQYYLGCLCVIPIYFFPLAKATYRESLSFILTIPFFISIMYYHLLNQNNLIDRYKKS